MPGRRVPADEQPAVWATFLAELWRWVAEHGDTRVPTTAVTTVDGIPYFLGSRVKNARVYYRRGSLTAGQIAQLEAVPGWSWNAQASYSADAWRARVAALRAYVTEHGSLAGLRRADPSLGIWLQQQRRRDDLTPQQRGELDAVSRALDDPTPELDAFLSALRAWIAAAPGREASHPLHSTVVTVAGAPVRLGSRAATWRSRYHRGELTAVDIARLEAVPGWTWQARGPGRRPRAIERLSKG